MPREDALDSERFVRVDLHERQEKLHRGGRVDGDVVAAVLALEERAIERAVVADARRLELGHARFAPRQRAAREVRVAVARGEVRGVLVELVLNGVGRRRGEEARHDRAPYYRESGAIAPRSLRRD
jgi:hypothetical protein